MLSGVATAPAAPAAAGRKGPRGATQWHRTRLVKRGTRLLLSGGGGACELLR